MELLPPLPLAPYELVAFPTVTADQMAAIVDRHDLDLDGPVAPMESNGVVHALWTLGSRYVVRVPKPEEMCIGDLRAEVVAIPVARAAGLRTPALIAFDDRCDIVDVPYAIVERVHGGDLSRLSPNDPRRSELYHQLGAQLAALHSAPPPSPHPWFREPESRDLTAMIEQVVPAGVLGSAAASWFTQILDGLEHDPVEPRFIHNDVKPDNLMVDDRQQLVIIDWGDAGFGDPAWDFEALPAVAIADALVGYRDVIEHAADPGLEQRIARAVIGHAIAGLRRSPLTGPSWYRPVAAGLADLLSFATDQPEVWRRWLGR